ncbi:MAG: c-type cytochrome [Bacteroidetes bacterium]|nr:c-type cytochrome [Bacteroidota bacterium]
MSDFKHNSEDNYIEIIQRLVKCIVILLIIVVGLVVLNIVDLSSPKKIKENANEIVVARKDTTLIASDTTHITAPDTSLISAEKNAAQIRYGRELIANTSLYFGPKGKIAHMNNGMNCQNCHLEAGTKPFGNNYLAVAATYPKFRERSGSIETIYKRVNDCFERSLNGKALDTLGNEMQAIQAYIKWLGKNMAKGEKPKGSGIAELKYLDRAADAEKGKIVYSLKCKTCHGEEGAGKFNNDNLAYQYPPLWGEHSYNSGAGLYRLSRFAAYVKYNMPQGASFKNIQLSDEEAWDVAAFVNSQPRLVKDPKNDWPKISGKPVDHPFGPYADNFSEKEHKYGPFGPIVEARKKSEKK